MKNSDSFEQNRLRILAIALLAVVGAAVLMVRLWRVQVADGERYQSDLRRQFVRRIRLPGIRGRVYDRKGVVLAENRPSYCIALYLEELRHFVRLRKEPLVRIVEDRLAELSDALGLESRVSAAQIEAHIVKRAPLPLLAWKDVGERAVAILAEGTDGMYGVDIYVEPVREYPQGRLTAHLVGYARHKAVVQSSKAGNEAGSTEGEAETDESYHYYYPEMVGERGVEMVYDGFLRGQAGGRLLCVDVMGFKRDLPGYRDKEVMRQAQVGSDIELTIDVRIQKLAEVAIEGEIGAAVVLDPRTGEVLAMASSPSFDPNGFVEGFTPRDWKELSQDPRHPLLNRATAGTYAPGSLFKVVVAMAAFDSQQNVSGKTSYQCPGFYAAGSRQLHCWNWEYGGHGLLDMRQALEQSCNVYFCELGNACGYKNIYGEAELLGLGRKTGLDIDMEREGRLPKARMIQSKGDLANISIGQGSLEVTPLQMAVITSAIANGGRVYRPRLLRGVRDSGQPAFDRTKPVLARDMKWSKAALDTVRFGMLGVVESRRGTGKRAHVEGIRIAGKTGTAEYGRQDNGKKKGWMAAFAPFDEPTCAIAIVIDESVSGGITVAPRVAEMIKGIMKLQETDDGNG